MFFDRFDIAEAYYCYYSDYHSGQWSAGYRRLCKIGRYFSPRPTLSVSTLSDNASVIYSNLVSSRKAA